LPLMSAADRVITADKRMQTHASIFMKVQDAGARK
jgi:hypothetical protein